jgi:hypothetical protein
VPAGSDAASDDGAELDGYRSLLECLRAVPEPRRRCGIRHRAAVVLAFAVAAVLAGADSMTAITEWAADAPPDVLAALEARCDRRGRRVPPSPSTFRRLLRLLDAEAVAAGSGTWLSGQVMAGQADAAALIIALDGKTVRGARTKDGTAPHLLAAMICGARAVIAQRDVDVKTNEITQVKPLLEEVDITGALVTADALHVQKETARYLVEDKGADYLFTAVEHASHCSCCLSWRVKESSLAVSDLDTQAFAASLGEVDGVELAALDLVQHGLAGDAEVGGGLAEGQPAVGCLGPDAVTELLVDADLPGCSGGELLADAEPATSTPPAKVVCS